MGQLFIHSRCCDKHWELKFEDGKYDLVCEGCNKSIGSGIVVSGPDLTGCHCKECGAGDEENI